ncbi:MAG: hypothetical protein LBT53_01645 [Puniceicoccales bacterium]|nr:hypothetical protein [Puniceicoccales bacterium]
MPEAQGGIFRPLPATPPARLAFSRLRRISISPFLHGSFFHVSSAMLKRTFLKSLLAIAAVCAGATMGNAAPETPPPGTLAFHLKTRDLPEKKGGPVCENTVRIRTEHWKPAETGIIIIDMWGRHGCPELTARINELGPVMNEMLNAAREKGIFIVHAPSGDLQNFDKDYPENPKARLTTKSFRKGFGNNTHWPAWEHGSPSEEGAPMPIDNRGGCASCADEAKRTVPIWRQTEGIKINDKDSLTDDYKEIIDAFKAKGIKNVIIMGVHTNMCILGRPFGLRAMKKQGFNTVLMRDMTDLSYNDVPGSKNLAPHVPHFTGLRYLCAYIETYVTPTILSTDITGKRAFRFKEADREWLTVDTNTLPPPAPGKVAETGDRIRFRLQVRDVPQKRDQKPTDNAIHVRTEDWKPTETAILICDMWTQHGCRHATANINELGPVMNKVISAARNKGVLIIHAPSGNLQNFDIDYPEKPKARLTSKAFRKGFGNSTHWPAWEHGSKAEDGYPFPVRANDGGCPECGKPGFPGLPHIGRQTASLEIKDNDVLTDDYKEIFDYLRHRGVKNVIMMGVHTNMCILGRPFGLRALRKQGFNTVFMRDMTDLMYNNAPGKENQWPKVNHFDGQRLVNAYIETFVCPTVLSTDITGTPAFRFKADTGAEKK